MPNRGHVQWRLYLSATQRRIHDMRAEKPDGSSSIPEAAREGSLLSCVDPKVDLFQIELDECSHTYFTIGTLRKL